MCSLILRVCKHGGDVTQFLIDYVLSHVHFDWLVGNVSMYHQDLSSRSKQTAFSIICPIIFKK